MAAVTELASNVGTRAACRALFAPRASYYRERRAASSPAVTRPRPRLSPARALRPSERATVLAHLHGERFQDRSPAAVYATLLDEGEYHCSIRTMYRLLEQKGEARERRDQVTHPPYQKPELLATAHPAGPAHAACRSRHVDEFQASSVPAGRFGSHENAQPPARIG